MAHSGHRSGGGCTILQFTLREALRNHARVRSFSLKVLRAARSGGRLGRLAAVGVGLTASICVGDAPAAEAAALLEDFHDDVTLQNQRFALPCQSHPAFFAGSDVPDNIPITGGIDVHGCFWKRHHHDAHPKPHPPGNMLQCIIQG